MTKKEKRYLCNFIFYIIVACVDIAVVTIISCLTDLHRFELLLMWIVIFVLLCVGVYYREKFIGEGDK